MRILKVARLILSIVNEKRLGDVLKLFKLCIIAIILRI